MSCSINSVKENEVVFKVSLGGEPTSLDPQIAIDIYAMKLTNALFRGLTDIDSKTGGYKEGLAKTGKISSDGLTYTFHLRDNIVWSDGVPITAEGIRKSFLRVLDKKTGAKQASIVKETIKNGIEYYEGKVTDKELGIEVVDKKTLKIILTTPKPYFLDLLASMVFTPVPVHIIEKHGDKWTEPKNMVSSGAFKLKDRIHSEKIILERNEKDFNFKNIEIKELVFYSTKDNIIAYNMYKNNELDAILGNISLNLVSSLSFRDDYFSYPINRVHYLWINTNTEPLNNVKVRKALSLSIDRNTIAKSILHERADAIVNFVPFYSNYSYDKDLELSNFNLAKQLLAEAGYPNGKNFPTITLKYNASELYSRIVEFIQYRWQKNLNIKVELYSEEWQSFLGSKAKGDYQIATGYWIGAYDDPMTFFKILTPELTHFSSYNYYNQEYIDLLKQSDTNDLEKRELLLKKAENIIIKDCPVIPLYRFHNNYLFNNEKWTGLELNSLERFDFSKLRMVK